MTRMTAKQKKRMMIAIVVGLVLVAGAAAAWQVSRMNQPASQAENTLSEEEKLLNKLDAAVSPEEKAAAYTELANYYNNQPDAAARKKAVSYAEKAAEAQPTASNYGAVGYMQSENENKDDAIAAYEKAAEMSEKTALDDGRSDYSYYMTQAQLLREGKE